MGETDFSWSEVGGRIKGKRIQLGMSQQALASAAHLTQNGVFRLETGATNPQLSSLQQIAGALGCSVRDLVVGSSEISPILAERFRRVQRVAESGDEAAMKVMDGGIEAAEALVERSGRQRSLPPNGDLFAHPRKVVLPGKRRAQDEALRWMKGSPGRGRSETNAERGAQVVQKAGKPFRNPDTTYETEDKQRRP